MTDTTAVEDSGQQRPLMIAKPPSFCRTCNLELSAEETWRAHVKSDNHVYNLRVKVSEPETAISPPTPPPGRQSPGPSRVRRRTKPDETHSEVDADDDEEHDIQLVASDTEDDDEPPNTEFSPRECLFCARDSSTLDDNMAHMATAHGFSVPFQDCLAVDLETIIAYLHFIIHSYRECICCGTQRSTVEGTRQHMVAKGHCRFDVSPDTEEFYQMPQSVANPGPQLDSSSSSSSSMPMRLPSGKLIAHRKNLDTVQDRHRRAETPERDHIESEPNTTSSSTRTGTSGLEVATRQQGRGQGELVRSSEAILAVQLSKLRIAGDRIQQKEEARRRGRLESANNVISMKHFRVDAGDSRFGQRC
ncbi:C2H2 type zinc-finger-domain-containing protein [Apodospora peruviana]|uniref:C2H2 type zinc-finger-domain-containing protein n=1 Tax=Apodospora peruviana TaxID=516989 RepID=A0AAE0IGX6_9PEZI|nr:C2H2 type zinc-finger-domain-containing protein [Apodospora peruviana]